MSAPGTECHTAIARGLAEVRANMDEAARAAGRAAEDVTLVAVSKTYAAEAVQDAIAYGQLCFGENRVQEAAQKFALLRQFHPGLRLHLIGGLQTNKAEDAVRISDMIESLDRPKLAQALEAAAQRTGRLPHLLIQVNVGEEPSKSGIPPAQADAFIAACQARFGPALRGLMCIPPAGQDPSPYFRMLAAMRARHDLPVLSMGMSGDYRLAIALGATQIRVGSAIFGVREPA